MVTNKIITKFRCPVVGCDEPLHMQEAEWNMENAYWRGNRPGIVKIRAYCPVHAILFEMHDVWLPDFEDTLPERPWKAAIQARTDAQHA